MERFFVHEIQGRRLKFDPFRVRRLLLQASSGRAWDYLRDLKALNDELNKVEELRRTKQDGDPDLKQLDALRAVHLHAMAKLEGVLANAAMEAFEFEPCDPNAEADDATGVSEAEAMVTLQAFIRWAEGKDYRPEK